MKNLKQGILKAIGGAIENTKILSEDLTRKIQSEGLLLAGPSAAQMIFSKNGKCEKPRLIKLVNNEASLGPSIKVEREDIEVRIFNGQIFEDHEVIPIKIIRGEKEKLPQIFTFNLEQIILDFNNFEVFYTKPFIDFYEDKQIKIINFISPKLFLKKLKDLNRLKDSGHINIDQERKMALLFFFFHFNLSFKKNDELRLQLTHALIEISKKVDINILRRISCSPQELFFLIRIALETSSKKSNRIFKILSQKRFTHITRWGENSVKEFNILFSKDVSSSKLKNVGLLLYLNEVKTIAGDYTRNNLCLNDLIDDLTFIYNKSYKDLNITQNNLKEYTDRYPGETLKNVQKPTIWSELNATEEITNPIFPEGVTVKKLKTTNDLIREGKRMKHCLGKIRRFSETEERYFFSLYYKGEYSSLEIQRNVRGSTKEASPMDLLSEFERMLGGGPNNYQPGPTERSESGYLEGIEPECHYIFSIRGKCNKNPSLAHQQIAESLCKYLDQKRLQKRDSKRPLGETNAINKKAA